MQRHRGLTRVHAFLLTAALSLWGWSAHADFYVTSYPVDPTTNSNLDQVLHYDNAGNFLGVFVQPSSNLVTLRGIAFGPDGNLYAGSDGDGSVRRYDGTAGAFIDAFVPAGGGGLKAPEGLAFGTDGFFYVSDFGSNPSSSGDVFLDGKIIRYDATTGALDSVFSQSSDIRGNCDDMKFGPNGNLFVCVINRNDPDVPGVLQFDGKTGAFINQFTQGTDFSVPRALAFGPDGTLYVADWDGNDANGDTRIARFDGTTGKYIDDYIPHGKGLYATRGLGFGPDGKLYISSLNPNATYDTVYVYDGTDLNVFIDGNADASMLSYPRYFTFH